MIPENIFIGGLLRCCIQTLVERTEPSAEGTIVSCKWCPDGKMKLHLDGWHWLWPEGDESVRFNSEEEFFAWLRDESQLPGPMVLIDLDKDGEHFKAICKNCGTIGTTEVSPEGADAIELVGNSHVCSGDGVKN